MEGGGGENLDKVPMSLRFPRELTTTAKYNVPSTTLTLTIFLGGGGEKVYSPKRRSCRELLITVRPWVTVQFEMTLL